MKFRPLRKPLLAPRRARTVAALGLMSILVAFVFIGFGAISFEGALVALGVASALAALALLQSIYGLARIWRETGKGTIDCLIALVWALPVIVCASALYFVLTRTPSYPDLTTNLSNPPQFSVLTAGDRASLTRLDDTSAEERSALLQAFPDFTTVYIERPGWHLANIVEDLAEGNGWEQARIEQVGNQTFEIELSATGAIPFVPHLVAVRIIDDGRGSLVDFRSVATTPMHDFGTNARVLRRVMVTFDQALSATPPPASDL